jgi:hypothetical protein
VDPSELRGKKGANVDVGALTVVTALVALVALRAVARAVRLRHSLNGNRGRAWWAATLVLVTSVAGLFEAGHHQRQALATDAMLVLSVTPHAQADCERLSASMFNLSQYDGFVYHANSDVALYKHQICKDLGAYASSNKISPTLEQIAAVHLIAHETMHVNGIWSESEAECHAAQLSHLVAERLGATPTQARELQAHYFAELYESNRPHYKSSGCRAGGALDLHPERAEFP